MCLMRREPVAHARIEVIDPFPVERMASARIEMQFRAGDGAGDFLSHPARRENIRLTANHERRTTDAPKLREDIVPNAGCRLSLERVQGLGLGILGGLPAAFDLRSRTCSEPAP